MVTLEIGRARTINGFFNLIHLINLDEYNEQIQVFSELSNKFEDHTLLKGVAKVCKLKTESLKNKLHILNPYKTRTKRGLINGLGSAIKFITGNLDTNDADTINRQIQNLENQVYDSTNFVEHQTGLNLQMIERFKNLTKHINSEQEIISSFTNKLSSEFSNNIRKEEDTIAQIQYANQLIYNIDLLTNHISDIIEAVTFAKLGIISKLILHPDELHEARRYLEKQNVNLISDEHLYELLELQAYYNNSNLVFNIRIPNLSQGINTLYHVIPLPINDTKRIITKPYVNCNKHNLQYLTETCPKIENIYYCKKSTDFEERINSNCIGRILNGSEPICPIEDVGNMTTIFQPEKNYVMFINVKPLLLHSSTCSNTNITVEGTSLLHFVNCTITVAGITYKDDPSVYWDNIYIVPPNLNKIQTTSVTEVLNLEKLKDFTFENKDAIITFKKKYTYREYTTILLIIPIILMMALCMYLTWRKQKITYHPNPSQVALSPSNSLWPSLYS